MPTFIAPMDIPLELSGNFMEPRSDHFHSGLDIRTQGQEGIPVRAVADGWVSRIKISPWGYGNAVYVQHPNGYTTVYGHLKELKDAVAEATLDQQYRQKDFSIDLYPEKGAIPLVQGEEFAISGNSGGSSGPHLHFEIRRTADQHALDPESLGMSIRDNTPPEIFGVRIYPLTDGSRVAPYPLNAKGYATQGASGRYGLKPGTRPSAYGTVGFALHTLDRYDNNSARFGVKSIALFVDSVPVFTTQFTELDFDVNRYCNAHLDHALYKDSRMEYHRCYRLPNNKLKIYGREAAQGRITLEPGKDHHVFFVVTDKHGNRSELTFLIHGADLAETLKWPDHELEGSLFRYDSENILSEEGIRFTMPPMALYDDLHFRYSTRPATPKAWSPVHVLHDPLIPIQLHCDLAIEVPELPVGSREKALLVKLDAKGRPASIGGSWDKGRISARVRAFGAYTVMIDSTPPTITNVDLRREMKGRKDFSIRISDDLAGIAEWKATMNGKWVLFSYDPKKNMLTHTFDKHTNSTGPKEFMIEVTDDRGNVANWSMNFNR